jgi:hypothetical protein
VSPLIGGDAALLSLKSAAWVSASDDAGARRPKMTSQTKKQSKSASVTKMLSRGGGATVAEIMKSTGWKEHSCRAFLTGVRKTSKLLKEQRPDGKTAYRIELAQAEVTAE